MEIKVLPIDSSKLYRKVAYNDDNGTVITEVVPVMYVSGRICDDPVRQPRYEGLCFFNGQPITFKIEGAVNLAEACAQFPLAVQKVADELETQQRKAQILAAANQRPPRAPR